MPSPSPGNEVVGPRGLLVDHELETLADAGSILRCTDAVAPPSIEPASVDLHLSSEAYQLMASFVPDAGKVETAARALSTCAIDMTEPVVLEPGGVYLIRLQETLRLPRNVYARANPKSSTGRIDVFARVLCDAHPRFDELPMGYAGSLWVEVYPRTFPIRVSQGVPLTQLRLYREERWPASASLVCVGNQCAPVERGDTLTMHVSLHQSGDEPIGYQARPHTPILDLVDYPTANVADFWTPIFPDDRIGDSGILVLEPEAFYLFASHERIRIPRNLAGDMIPVDPTLGELRSHYAGFFDPGFGWDCESGALAVLEVRVHDVPFGIRHAQPLFRLTLEKTSSTPAITYDNKLESHYVGQGLAHSKYFRKGES